GEGAAEGSAVGSEVVADPSFGGDDTRDPDDREMHGPLEGAAASLDEFDDAPDAVAAEEGGMLLGSHGSGRVDEDDVGGMMVDVH
ncbi:hypothetical protein SB658_25755, partial [Bacillus sp. SIMBA_008]|uniref:hypothetical protein n=1 Tax=Bacillus sp. SIMBA_008 TaxID=3085757 RepID=UPI003979CA40